MMYLFDELISNIDRNQGNIVYTKDWRLWLIDHTRAFRKNSTLKVPARSRAATGRCSKASRRSIARS